MDPGRGGGGEVDMDEKNGSSFSAAGGRKHQMDFPFPSEPDPINFPQA